MEKFKKFIFWYLLLGFLGVFLSLLFNRVSPGQDNNSLGESTQKIAETTEQVVELTCLDGSMFYMYTSDTSACKFHKGFFWSELVIRDKSTGAVLNRPSDSNGSGGSGYQVTCADGWVSNSGGRQGACSHHGGVR